MTKYKVAFNSIWPVAVIFMVMGLALAAMGCNADRNTDSRNETEYLDSGSSTSTAETTTENNIPPEPTLDERAEQILNNMTLKEKICQMFVIAPENMIGGWNVQSAGADMEEKLKEYPVSGFIFFDSNLTDPEQTKTMLSNLQSYSHDITGLTFFTCIDEEGGRVARVGNNPAFGIKKVPAMNTIQSEADAYDAGYTIGEYLSELGFNFDFAPDADVLSNPENTLINDRSFGSDAQIVSQYAVAYAKGLGDNNVLSTFKHFPGHGGTQGDTHEGFAYTNKTLEELMQEELKPFIAAGQNNVDAVMIAHISVPAILGDNTPCSLSNYMITDVLKNQMGYQGLIVTDALGMGAITNEYTDREAAVLAVLAGNDILLKPADFYEAYAGVYEAVENGRITQDRINESVLKIIKVKLQLTEE
ncbi:MAG: glycoside hydrolase family 3 protein [Butyrivibrio sp.]